MTNEFKVEDLEPKTPTDYVEDAIREYNEGKSIFKDLDSFKKGELRELNFWEEHHIFFSDEIEAARQYFNEFLGKQDGHLQENRVPSRKRNDDGER